MDNQAPKKHHGLSKADISTLNKRKPSVEDFTGNPVVKKCVDEIKKLKDPVSDVLDKEGHQYVNLVQKGGGVLGVALVGYVYILEQAGIRFLKLAGTSAGAINTSLMVIPPDKTKEKSPFLIDALINLDLFKLVDGHAAAKFLVKNFVKKPDFGKQVGKTIRNIVVGLVALIILCCFMVGWQKHHPSINVITCAVFVITGLYILSLGIIGAYVSSLMKRLKNSGFGINPGDFFYDWVKKHMVDQQIDTINDLVKRSEETPPLFMRPGRDEQTDDLKGKVVFITSELVTQNKFEFPEMAHLFRLEADIKDIHPAGFVRASMAIPFFFESYYIDNIPCADKEIKRRWMKAFEVDDPPSTARFVDGGILSNFPINLFYNKDIKTPRLPTFGIDLDDTKPEDQENHPASWTFGGYMGRMFNTTRYYYDKDFKLKNRIMTKGVGQVPVADFNWLNFFLTNDEQLDLFCIGAEAAVKFLRDFKWEDYKNNREDYFNTQKPQP